MAYKPNVPPGQLKKRSVVPVRLLSLPEPVTPVTAVTGGPERPGVDAGVLAREQVFRRQMAEAPPDVLVPALAFRSNLPYEAGRCHSCGEGLPRRPSSVAAGDAGWRGLGYCRFSNRCPVT
jgi:hypothetical protein